MEEILIHPWMNKGQSEPLSPAPFPNRLTPDDIKEEIIEHIVQKLKVKCSLIIGIASK